MGNLTKPLGPASRRKIRQFFDSIKDSEIAEQTQYWESKKPKTVQEYRNRWMFAFASVHTTWGNNVNQYNEIKNRNLCSIDSLTNRLIISAGGMHHIKAKSLYHFGCTWRQGHEKFISPFDSYIDVRNEISKELLGLSNAKTSFAIEMCNPIDADVVCLDRHMLRLFNADPEKAPSNTLYYKMEQYWLRLCKIREVPSYIARCIFWDRANNETNSHYWAYIL